MGNELNEKNCMNRIPWMLLELVYPIFMLILLGVASVGKAYDIRFQLIVSVQSEHPDYLENVVQTCVFGSVTAR